MINRVGAALLTLSAAAGATLGESSGEAAPLEQPLPVPAAPQEQDRIPKELQPAVDALNAGNAAAAVTLARQYLKKNPGSAVGHEVLGEAARQRRLWSEAEQALRESLRLEPTRLGALLKLGADALDMGDAKKAEERGRQAVAMAPKSVLAHRLLAVALARQSKLGDAIQSAEEALRLSGGQDVDTKFLLGGFYYDVGRMADSERL